MTLNERRPRRTGRPPKFGTSSPPVEVVRALLEMIAENVCGCMNVEVCGGDADDMSDCDSDCTHKAAVEWLAARDADVVELREAIRGER